MSEITFTINNQFVMFIEDTKTHRIKISWDKGEMWLSKAKALAVHKWLTEFVKSSDDNFLESRDREIPESINTWFVRPTKREIMGRLDSTNTLISVC